MPSADAPEPMGKHREDSLERRERGAALTERADAARVRPTLTRLATTLGMAGLEASSVGLAGWVIRDPRWIPPYARDNHVNHHVRAWIFLNVGVALAVAALAVTIIFAWKRRDGLDVLEKCVRLLSPLSLAALGAFLFDHRLWPGRDMVFLTFALAWGFGMRAAAASMCESGVTLPRRAAAALARLRSQVRTAARGVDLPLLAVLAGACLYTAYFSVITVAHYRNFGSSAFDLGGWDNLMWNVVHRGNGEPVLGSTPFMGPAASHLARHATFFAYVIAPVYALAPRPETLLVLQAAMLGAAAVPLFLYARRHIPPWTAALVAWLYLIYPPLHGANLYDFQFLPLGIPFLWLLLYAIDSGRRGLAIAATILALAVREDVGFCVGVLGLWLLLSGTAARAGALLAIVGTGYFLLLKLGVMPHFADGSETFVNQYAGLLPPGEHTFGSILETISVNPPFTANVLLERDKLVYVLKLLAPVLLAPLASPLGFVLLIPGVIFTLLSTGYEPLYQISFQYTAYWTPFVFIAAVVLLERSGNPRHAGDVGGPLRRRALAVGLAAASLACSYLYGAILPHENLRCGPEFPRFHSTPDDVRGRAELAALAPWIPADAKVAASEHLLPHVSGRADAYTLRFGVHDAEYMLFAVPMRGDERDVALPIVRDGTFGVLEDLGDMVLAKRGEPASRNDAVVARATQR